MFPHFPRLACLYGLLLFSVPLLAGPDRPKTGVAPGPNGESINYVILNKEQVSCAVQLSELGNGYVYGSDLKTQKEAALAEMGLPKSTQLPFFFKWECTSPGCTELASFMPDQLTGRVQCKTCGTEPTQHTKVLHLQHDGQLILHESDLATNAKQAKAVFAGSKWICGSEGCGVLNHSIPEQATCVNCGASGKNGKKVTLASEKREIDPSLLDLKEEPTHARGNRSHEMPVRDNHTKDTSKGYFPEIEKKMPPWVKDHRGKILAGGGILGAMLTAAFSSWLLATDEAEGTVQDGEWEHAYYLETFTRVSDRDWENNLTPSRSVMPVGGKGGVAGVENIRDCRPAIHHYDEVFSHYETEYYEVSDDPSPSSSDYGGGSDWGGGGSDFGGGGGGGGASDYGNGGGSL